MARKPSGRPTGRPTKKQASALARPDYPIVVWPYGSPRGSNGYVAVVPHVSGLRAEAMDVATAIARVETQFAKWLASTPPRDRPTLSELYLSMHPGSPIERLDDRRQFEAVQFEGEALAKNGSAYGGFWGVPPTEIAERFTSPSGKMLLHERTVERWREGVAYKVASMSEARQRGWKPKPIKAPDK